jgi:putative DNA primase/helicase
MNNTESHASRLHTNGQDEPNTPHSPIIEKAVLGWFLLKEVSNGDFYGVELDDFFLKTHQEIFELMQRLPVVSLALLIDELQRNGSFKRLSDRVHECTLDVPRTIEAVTADINQLKKYRRLRESQHDAGDIVNLTASGDINGILNLSESILERLSDSQDESRKDDRRLDFITHCTDEGNAQRLVSQHGDNLRWVHELNCWFTFHEGQWNPDNALARRWALDVPRKLYLKAGASDLEKNEREELFKFAMRTENERSQRAMLELAKKHLTVHIDQFDRDPWLFNCANGTLNLKTGEFRDHRREDMLTCISPTVWTGQENCDRFTLFLEEVFQGDYEVISYVRRAVGLSLVGQVIERKLFFCWGGGNNGKSTLLETLAFVFGSDYAGAASPDLLMDADYSQQAHELASLRSLRLVTAIETSEGRRLAESRVKQITGRDRVKACMKYGHPFEYTPKFTVWLATNHKPVIRGTDNAIWHRLSGLIPFEAEFTGDKDDHELPAKLQSEASGILAWAVRGLTEYLETGLGSASKIDQEVAKYRSESDVLADFLADRCVVGDGLSVSRGDIWQEYKKWCADTGTDSINSTTFGRRLNEKGFIRDATGKKRLGIGLKSCGE